MNELIKKLSGITLVPASAIIVLAGIWVVEQLHGVKPPPALDQAIVTAFGALFAADAKKKNKEDGNDKED